MQQLRIVQRTEPPIVIKRVIRHVPQHLPVDVFCGQRLVADSRAGNDVPPCIARKRTEQRLRGLHAQIGKTAIAMKQQRNGRADDRFFLRFKRFCRGRIDPLRFLFVRIQRGAESADINHGILPARAFLFRRCRYGQRCQRAEDQDDTYDSFHACSLDSFCFFARMRTIALCSKTIQTAAHTQPSASTPTSYSRHARSGT